MRSCFRVWIHSLLTALVAAIVVCGAGQSSFAADEYAYDPVHSSVGFKARHLDISWIHGRFNEVEGKFSLDRQDPSKSTFTLKIKADSVDTANKARDEHLRQPDYFDTKQFPTIEFKSTSAKVIAGGYEVTGDFTMHGKTKKITLVLKGGKEIEFKGKKIVGFSTEISLKRSDFDFDKSAIGPIGDEALIFIDCEGVRTQQMPEPLLYVESMGAAAIVSTLCLLAMAGRQRPVTATWVNSACVLAICLGILVGNAVLSPRLIWPPVSALDRFMTIVVPAALGIELVAGFKNVPPAVAWVLRLGLVIAISPILLDGSIYLDSSHSVWSAAEAGTTLAACAALLAGVWALLEWLTRRAPAGISISLALALATQTAGLTVMMAGYLKGGAAAFPLAATLAATTLSAWLAAKRIPPAIIGMGVVQLFGLLFIGRFFGRLSTGSALAILLAPLVCWVTEIIPLRQRNPWLTGSLRLVLVAIPLLAVLIAAKRNFDRDMAPLLGCVQSLFFFPFIFLSTFRH